MTWQALIANAATDAFNRTGRRLAFRLVREDLLALAAEVADLDLDQVERGIRAEGFLTIRVVVPCPPLGGTVVVDEWVVP